MVLKRLICVGVIAAIMLPVMTSCSGNNYGKGLTVREDNTSYTHDKDTDVTSFSGKVYYVSKSGNDNADGLSKEKAFKTIARVNKLNLLPGDAVLFESGGIYDDACLEIKNCGTVDKHIVISYYSKGEYPIVRGGIDRDEQYHLSDDGTAKVSIKITSAYNVTVRGLHLNGANFGIFLNNVRNVDFNNSQLSVDDCVFTNIYGYHCVTLAEQGEEGFIAMPPFYSNAIEVGLRGQLALSKVSITDSIFKDCDAAWHLDTVTKVYIKDVDVDNMFREGALFESCQARKDDISEIYNLKIRNTGIVYGKDHGTAAIQWNVSTNFICNNLELSYTGNAGFGNDMLGGDYEATNRNITVQGSYIHHNGGSGWLIYKTPGWGRDNDNISLKNNIFAKNGLMNDDTAAFLRHQFNENSTGEMTNNKIYLAYKDQKLNYIDGENTNTFPGKYDFTGTKVEGVYKEHPIKKTKGTIYSFEFDNAYDTKQWTGWENIDHSNINGLYLTSVLNHQKERDAELMSDKNMDLKLKGTKWFQIKLKNKTTAESMKVYFSDENGKFSDEFLTIPIKPMNDGFVEYTLYMKDKIDLDTVDRIKILPAVGAKEGWVQYDYIRFIK